MATEKSTALEAFRQRLYTQAKNILDFGLTAVDADPDNAELAQAVYEVWSRNMGALDAMMCLRGVPHETRMNALREGILEGKKTTLAAHSLTCKGCEPSDILRDEIESLH